MDDPVTEGAREEPAGEMTMPECGEQHRIPDHLAWGGGK